MARWARARFALLWFIVFRCFFVWGWLLGCRMSDCRMSDCRIVGLSDCFGNWFPQRFGEHQTTQGTKAPHKPHSPRARAKENIRGELNTSMVFDALREKFMNVSVGGVLEIEQGLQEKESERN